MSDERGAIRPHETVYNGYHFRSRLEARWALFFDELSVIYRYEPEGYRVAGKGYLPDFYFPTQYNHEGDRFDQCFVEIKSDQPTEEELYKAEWLAQYTGIPTYLFSGDVWYPEEGGAHALLYQVRQAYLSLDGKRILRPLPLSNELRVALLHLYDAGLHLLVNYPPSHLPDFLISPKEARMFAAPERVATSLQQVNEMKKELLRHCKERVSDFLQNVSDLFKGYMLCDSHRSYALRCPREDSFSGYLCDRAACRETEDLAQTMSRNLQNGLPLSLQLEFDSGLSPEKHFWAVCTDSSCSAVGIFPTHFQHGTFCGIKCRDGEWPGMLEGVSYGGEREYLQASCRAIEGSEHLRSAYTAARQARFEHGQTPKKPSQEKQYRIDLMSWFHDEDEE